MAGVSKLYFLIHGVKFGKNLRMRSLPICRKHRQATIEIGEDVIVNNKICENLAGITHRSVLAAVSPDATLKIGNHVGMSGVILYCTKMITVGDYVNLGAGVRVYDTDFHPVGFAPRRLNDTSMICSSPVTICDDVWVGANAIILKGVTIGPRSVIAAGSVVAKDVPQDVIAAGVPAKIIRSIPNGK